MALDSTKTASISHPRREVWVAGNTFPMKTGETIIFPAGVPHALSAVTKFKMSLVMIKE